MIKNEKRPNFFVVGAPKSGTSTLFEYLGAHPRIFVSPVKEPGFFLPDEIGLTNIKEYMALFKGIKDEPVAGEATSGYLYYEQAPVNIAKTFPGSKIIIILRKPADMAYSLWLHMSTRGTETKSFEEAITNKEIEYRKSGDEFRRSCSAWWRKYLYLEQAAYYEQLKRYFDTFDRKTIKVYIFERFYSDTNNYVQDAYEFLGVEKIAAPEIKKANEGGVTRSQALKKISTGSYPLLKSIVPYAIRNAMRIKMQGMSLKKGKKPAMAPETREFLNNFYREDIAKTESLLDMEIPEWK